MSPSEDPQEPEELGTFMQFGTDGDTNRESTAAMTPPSVDFTPRSRNSAADPVSPTRPAFEPTAPTPVPSASPLDFTPGSGRPPDHDPNATHAHTDQTPVSGGKLSAERLDEKTFPATITPGLVLFKHFRTIRKLGAGGMGEVWLVNNQGIDDERALKLILPGQAFRPEVRARFKYEARLGAKIKHANSVTVHSADIGESVAYIEMEYLPGASLDRLLRKGEPPPLAWTRGVLEQLCNVLDFIHKEPISTVHRDLKPSNLILLDATSHSPGRLKLCDLGIAKSLNSQDAGTTASFRTGAGAMLFTPQYASPEQINLAMSSDEAESFSSDIDRRADIYALGVLMYQLLTGYLPFEGQFQAVILRHLNEAPPPFSKRNPAVKLPAALEKVVMRCLEKDRKNRPQSALEVLEDFLLALPEDDAGLSLPPTQPDYPSIWPTRGGSSADSITSLPHTTFPPNSPDVRKKPQGGRTKKVLTTLLALGSIGAAAVIGGKAAYDRYFVVTPVHQGDTTEPPPPPTYPAQELSDRGFVADPEVPKVTDGYPSRILKEVGGETVGFVLIHGGEFVMGHRPEPGGGSASALEHALPPRKVALTSFYMQETETSNGAMEAYLHSPEFAQEAASRNVTKEELIDRWAPLSPRFGTKSPVLPPGSPFPVTGITHELAEKYAEWIGAKLPTEAEWEYAARSRGADVLYPWDAPGKPSTDVNDLKEKAIIDATATASYSIVSPENTGDRTAQGVYHMMGNVREWCRDRFMPADNEVFRTGGQKPLLDPIGPATEWPEATVPFVIRGGSYATVAPNISVYGPRTISSEDSPDDFAYLKQYKSLSEIGFRTVVELKDAPAAP